MEQFTYVTMPYRPAMAEFKARVMTFSRNWPNHIEATAVQLAQAGLYYLGTSDRVKCFHCNGSLKDWTREDDPWFEHAKWYPSCEFLREKRGLEYVNWVSNQFPNLKRHTAHKTSMLVSESEGTLLSFFEAPCILTALEEAKRSKLYQIVLNIGFDTQVVEAVVKNHLETEHKMYTSLVKLISDVQAYSPPREQPSTSANGGLKKRHGESFGCYPRKTELSNQPCSPHMGNFRTRINTFSNWPNHISATPKQIAEAGFFFLGDRDRVKCFYCNGGLQNWTRNDEPWFEHAKWYPDCEFVQKSKGIEYVRSIASQFPDIKRPFAVAKRATQWPEYEFVPKSSGKSSQFQYTERPFAAASQSAETWITSFSEAPAGKNFSQPDWTEMNNLEGRVGSFDGHWPNHINATPFQLASAGFFYLGETDLVKCFHCNGVLQNWRQNDDPWLEHAKRFPRCGYVIRCKGRQFIENARYTSRGFGVSSQSSHAANRFAAPQSPPLHPTSSLLTSINFDASIPNNVEDASGFSNWILNEARNMGFAESSIAAAAHRKMQETGEMYTSLEALVHDLQEYELMYSTQPQNSVPLLQPTHLSSREAPPQADDIPTGVPRFGQREESFLGPNPNVHSCAHCTCARSHDLIAFMCMAFAALALRPSSS